MNVHLSSHTLRQYKRVRRLLETLDPAGEPWAVVSPGSKEPRGDIIVFPGSFNPPTTAHLAMLKQARKVASRQGGRWRVYVAISKQIVDKETVERMTLLDRVVLLERVLKKHVKHAGILLLNRGLYVEQARGIRAAFPEVRRLFFLVGFDKIVQIFDPHYYADREAALRELFALAHLLVAPRGSDGERELRELLARPENRPYARYVQPLPLAEEYRAISSTRVRQGADSRLREVPEEARDFILRTRPYSNPELDLYGEWVRALQELLD
jgi:nicotinamide-nucleotide adenylyltransferase